MHNIVIKHTKISRTRALTGFLLLHLLNTHNSFSHFSKIIIIPSFFLFFSSNQHTDQSVCAWSAAGSHSSTNMTREVHEGVSAYPVPDKQKQCSLNYGCLLCHRQALPGGRAFSFSPAMLAAISRIRGTYRKSLSLSLSW